VDERLLGAAGDQRASSKEQQKTRARKEQSSASVIAKQMPS
jgi:hypothetical protein